MAVKLLELTDEQRQNLTTLFLAGGGMAMTIACGILIGLMFNEDLLKEHGEQIIAGSFWVIYGCLALIGVMTVAQAAIAVGGKISGKFGGAEITAEAENASVTYRTPPE